jgi:hypothetical protein
MDQKTMKENVIKDIEGKTFNEGVVELDNKRFVKCTFNNSILTYKGNGAVSFNNCSFNGAKWSVEGYALNALIFLKSIYNGLGEVGEQMVEGTFNQIRNKEAPFEDLPSDLGEYKRRILEYQNYVVIEYSKRPIFRYAMENVDEETVEANLLFDVKEFTKFRAVEKMKMKLIEHLKINFE